MKIDTHPKVIHFFKTIQKVERTKISRYVHLLRDYGPNLGYPQSKYIGNGLYELRIRGKREIRVFYFIKSNTCYLIHACIKKSQKTPIKELQLAYKRKSLVQI